MDHKAAIKRRDFLNWSTHGIGGAALSSMFLEDGFASQPINPHYAPNVKQVIHICLCGGISQVDSFDYKPKLKEMHGKSLQADEKPDVFLGKPTKNPDRQTDRQTDRLTDRNLQKPDFL